MFFKKKQFYIHTGQRTSSKAFSRHKFKSRLLKILPEISGYLLVVLVAWAFLQSTRISAFILRVKDQISSKAYDGTQNLERAKALLINQDPSQASLELNQAFENFNRSLTELKDLEANLLGLTRLLPQSRSAENLISASIDLTHAGQSALNFYELASAFSFNQFGLTRGSASFSDLISELAKMRAQLALAVNKIGQANIRSLPKANQAKISDTLKKIEYTQKAAGDIGELLAVGQSVFTGQKKVLLLFQNQNELRPTGGFIGSFTELELREGKIIKLKVASIYDLDGQLIDAISPPWPILSVNDRWFLRDANWFSSFNESAKKISEFFEKEGGETPDLILALTPQMVADIINVTGPLKTESGQTLDSQNLTENLQALTQGNPTDPTNEPKKILNELFTKLFQKIGQLQPEQKTQILEVIQNSFSAKQALLYSRHKNVQKVFESFNWAGRINQNSDRDYLLIVSANLGGTKTDLSIQQTYKLETEVGPNGYVQNHLTLFIKNQMPNLANAHNKSFYRIYVPENSELLETEGFDLIVQGQGPQSLGARPDPDVVRWEKAQTRDVTTGTVIGKESGKTFFGNWVTLQPGETRTVKITYKLPFKLKAIDRMSLLLQKQPGAQSHDFDYIVNYPTFTAVWQNFSQNQSNSKTLKTSGLLNKDQFFGIVLKQD